MSEASGGGGEVGVLGGRCQGELRDECHLTNTPQGENSKITRTVGASRGRGYPPKGVTKGMCADREEAVGSQEVIAAKCCPGRWLAARGRRGEGTKWGSWREKTHCTSQNPPKKQTPLSRVASRLVCTRRHIPAAPAQAVQF